MGCSTEPCFGGTVMSCSTEAVMPLNPGSSPPPPGVQCVGAEPVSQAC